MDLYKELINKAAKESQLTKDEIKFLLKNEGDNAIYLKDMADKIRNINMGQEVHLRGIIEFSNYCERHCLYCGLRRENTSLSRYRMEPMEILKVAKEGAALGYKTIVLQSGEDPGYTSKEIAGIVYQIKTELDVAVTLSIGEWSKSDYKLWKEAGADRYLLKHETASKDLYRKLHPHMEWDNRIKCLYYLKELGYQVGSGSIVGLPDQTFDDLAYDLLLLKKLDVEMAGIGPFIPNPRTPLGLAKNGSVELTLKMIAIARLLMPKAHLPATTSLGSLDKMGREKALQWGANVVMPNITPNKYRKLYEIYPNKICLDDNPRDCRGCIERKIISLGRSVAMGPGHSPKEKFQNIERSGA